MHCAYKQSPLVMIIHSALGNILYFLSSQGWLIYIHINNKIRIKTHNSCCSVPSQPPTAFKLTASSSTSIIASWQLPPVPARHGRTITGFKLFYKKKGFGGSETNLTMNGGSMLNRSVTGLDKFTEYEFQVLAYTSDGDGPKSPVVVKRTKEDGKW